MVGGWEDNGRDGQFVDLRQTSSFTHIKRNEKKLQIHRENGGIGTQEIDIYIYERCSNWVGLLSGYHPKVTGSFLYDNSNLKFIPPEFEYFTTVI